METKLNESILALTERGLAKLAERKRKVAEKEFVEECKRKDAWDVLQESVRAAFPVVIGEFVFLPEETTGRPDDQKKYYYPNITIPGYAPIRAYVALKDGIWEQKPQPNDKYGEHAYFEIPGAEWDFEWGLIWSWKIGSHEMDELDEALGIAREEFKRYEKLVAEHAPKPAEFVYEAMDVENNTIVDELVKLIRDVVREEIAK